MCVCVCIRYAACECSDTRSDRPTCEVQTCDVINKCYYYLECLWNVMVQALKPVFLFRWNGRVHLNRRVRQFSRLLAAEVCTSALVMLDTSRSEAVWEYWLLTPFAIFPFTSPPLGHPVPSGFKCTLLTSLLTRLSESTGWNDEWIMNCKWCRRKCSGQIWINVQEYVEINAN